MVDFRSISQTIDVSLDIEPCTCELINKLTILDREADRICNVHKRFVVCQSLCGSDQGDHTSKKGHYFRDIDVRRHI